MRISRVLSGSSLAVLFFVSNISYATQEFIVGGQLVAEGDPVQSSTVALFDGEGLCSGSLVSADLIVTAGHCVTKNWRNMRVLFGLDVRAMLNPNSRGGAEAQVVGALVNPGFHGDSGRVDQDDIALVRFEGGLPQGYAPAALLPTGAQLQNGETVLLAGYGITEPQSAAGAGGTAGVLRKVEVQILKANFGRTEVLLDQTHGTGACHGDSGGPAFAEVEGRMFLWGVTSRGYPSRAPDDCAHDSVYTNIDAQLQFLHEAANQLQGGNG